MHHPKRLYSSKDLNINFFENKEDFPKNYLIKQLKAGKKVYFKGSRSSKMESYLELLVND